MTDRDPRAERSQTALIDAMITAIDEGTPLATISITDIVRRAGVSRPTFYQHYGALPALVHAAAVHRLGAAFARVPEAAPGTAWDEFSYASMTMLLGHLAEHERFYLEVLRSGGLIPVADIIDMLAARFLTVAPFAPAVRADPDLARERAEFLASGVTWSVVRWLENGGDDLDATARRFTTMLISAVSTAHAP